MIGFRSTNTNMTQATRNDDRSYAMRRQHGGIPMTQAQLQAAESLKDLQRDFDRAG